jgi:hypothetical protein
MDVWTLFVPSFTTHLEDVPSRIERVLEIPNLHRLWLFIRHHLYHVLLCLVFIRIFSDRLDIQPSASRTLVCSRWFVRPTSRFLYASSTISTSQREQLQ